MILDKKSLYSIIKTLLDPHLEWCVTCGRDAHHVYQSEAGNLIKAFKVRKKNEMSDS